MKRRTFIKSSSFTAFSMAAFGSISWNGTHFEGNSPTTSDILGPFYRPDSPLRSNLIPDGVSGNTAYVSGKIFQSDGKTPLTNALIEAWQCDLEEVYDNISDDFRFRASLRTDKTGTYEFKTIIPPPYVVGDDMRPAHIHMRISSGNYQDLITQIYFKGDPYLKIDPSSNSADAINRILPVNKNSNGEEVVNFDVVMSNFFPLSEEGFKTIEGLYQLEDGIVEFYKEQNLLMMKFNGQIMEGLVFKGNNLFSAANGVNSAQFQKDDSGTVTVRLNFWNYPDDSSDQYVLVGKKFMKY